MQTGIDWNLAPTGPDHVGWSGFWKTVHLYKFPFTAYFTRGVASHAN